MAENTTLIEYYADLLIIQYKTKANASATITAIIKALMIYDIITDVKNGYSLDTAIGRQLDVLGKYTGVSRSIDGVDFTRMRKHRRKLVFRDIAIMMPLVRMFNSGHMKKRVERFSLLMMKNIGFSRGLNLV